MTSENPDDRLPRDVVEGLRSVREEARVAGGDRPVLPKPATPGEPPKPLARLPVEKTQPSPSSPDREELNQAWNVATSLEEPPSGWLGRLFAPLRWPLQRLLRFALGPLVERQVKMNSAQVQFDNDLVRYLDERLDRMSQHYDRVLGLHGRRMEEIDERHLILQQELIRHVHDLVQRIEFVFEAAEQNHLYLEGMLRESREELAALAERLAALSQGKR